jgi:predicted HTH domain antitoxin
MKQKQQASIGVRVPRDMLSRIEKLSQEEHEDRSTTIRKLVMIGYASVMREKAARKYLKGDITLSEAAHRAGLSLWDMEKYLVEHGFKSDYSVRDLEHLALSKS